MNNGLEKYNNITIPKELNIMVNQTIQQHKKQKRTLISLAATLAAISIFTLSLNVSETFAESMQQIPLVKNIAEILTFREYHFESENISGQVNMPSITLSDDVLEIDINNAIESKVNEVLSAAVIRADEYKKAFIETGGTEEEFAEKDMTVTVDFEVFLQNNDYLSYRVFTNESLAAVYAENLYYNIDLNKQEMLSLSSLLGDNYIQIITEVIKKKVSEAPDLYFDEVKAESWVVRPDVSFYLTDTGVVIVLEKYEIGPGSMGRLEFSVPK